jgi:hypothetical protein
MAGDAVRIAADAMWEWGMWNRRIADRSAIGIIQGRIGYVTNGASIVFNHQTYRDGQSVSSSGGPATIFTDFAELSPTDETVDVTVWRFRDGIPGADRAEYYTIPVRVWEWRPTN